MLTRDYAQYYSKPTLENANRLWESISAYNFADYSEFVTEIVPLRQQAAQNDNNALSLQSNGSSQTPRSFLLGPHGLFWLQHIERKVKILTANIFNLGLSLSIPSSQFNFRTYNKNSQIVPVKYDFSMSPDRHDLIPKLLEKIESLPEQVILTSNPLAFLPLTAQKEMESYLLKGKIQSILPIGWEPFFKKRFLISQKVHINDNCVNWTTSLNFWTCPFNTKHFLPTFIMRNNDIVNLLNLTCSSNYPKDDLMIIDPQRSKCACGRWYLPFTFIPHIEFAIRSPDGRVIYDDTIPEELDSIYYNLQFVRTEIGIDILYSALEMSMHDAQWLQEFFEKYDLPVTFHRNAYSLCGLSKNLPFWGKPHAYQHWRQHHRIKHF